jgi:ArsR family metal-binding transcriptional regulator
VDDDKLLTTTFPSREELDRALTALEHIGAPYRRIDPTPPLARVALPALVVNRETRARLVERGTDVIFSGWVEHRTPAAIMPEGPEPDTPGACFQRAAIVVLQPCVADETKIRFTAHVQGDLAPVLPYLNAVMRIASFTPAAQTLTYMDRHRMVALYRHRITIAKADEIVDAWLILDGIRLLVEKTWATRDAIEPSYETRKRPPALEIWRRLPGTNCGVCGERTCMAFALRLWAGGARLRQCGPVFVPEQTARRAALVEICAGLGISDE